MISFTSDNDTNTDSLVPSSPKTKQSSYTSKDLLTTTSSKSKSKDSVPTTSSKAKSKDILLSKSTTHAKPKAGPTDSLRRSTRARN